MSKEKKMPTANEFIPRSDGPLDVLLFGGGPYTINASFQVLQCLRIYDRFRLHLLSPNQYTPLRFSRWIKSFTTIKTQNPSEKLAALKDTVRSKQISLVVPLSAPEVGLLGQYGDDELSSLTRWLRIPKTESFNVANSKVELVRFLSEKGINHPKSIIIENKKAIEAIERLRFPVIAKPSQGAGGGGIYRCESPEQLNQVLDENLQEIPYLVQEYISGVDVGFGAFCIDGKIVYSVTQRDLDDKNGFFGPSKRLEFCTDDSVVEAASKLFRLLAWEGVGQIDFRQDSRTGELFVLEINPRFWGSLYGAKLMGVNFPLIACLDALAESPPPIVQKFGKYINHTTYLKERLKQFMSKNYKTEYKALDSNLPEFLSDPSALSADIAQRIWSHLPFN